MNKKILAASIGLMIALTGCGGGNTDETENNSGETAASAGDEARLFEVKCASCHGVNLQGGAGPKLSDIGTRLTKEDIEKVIAEGKGMMPKELVKGEDADKLAAWLAEKK